MLAHRPIDECVVDVVHGHSSHHPKPIEVYNGKLILYGCGDFLNDYEGISDFRSHLVLMYFVTVDPSTGKLQRLLMTPLEIRRFRLNHVHRRDAEWLRNTLTREGKQTATEVTLTADEHLLLQWSHRQRRSKKLAVCMLLVKHAQVWRRRRAARMPAV